MVVTLARSVRSLALKIASYGVMHLIVAMLVAFAITQDWRMALAIGVVEPFFQTIAYTFHDRVWHRIEQRRLRSGMEETAEAFTARLDVMNAEEQARAHGHHGHTHALPSFRKIAVKTVTYGVMHLIVAILVAFAITRDWRIALAIGMVEPFFQTIAYSFHDRVWHRIERRRRLSRVEETAEAFTARLDIMNQQEQDRSHGHAGHSHALPTSFKQIAAKTVTYGVMHFAVAVAVAFALTRNWQLALAIGTIEPLVQTLFFTVHDRVWTRIEARKARRAAELAEV